jgi:phenylalanyl-tRNA synthetase beta chain
VPSLLDVRRINESLNNPQVELFEIARTYLPTQSALPREQPTLAAVSGDGFLHVKGVVEALLTALHIEQPLELAQFRHELLAVDRASELKLGDLRLGFLGEISPAGQKGFSLRGPATIVELDLAQLSSQAKLGTIYAPQSPYPTIGRDLNLIVADSVRWADLAATVRAAAGPSLERLQYLDTYRDPAKDGEGTKRLTFALTLRAADRTLTGPEADATASAVVAACQTSHGAKLLA